MATTVNAAIIMAEIGGREAAALFLQRDGLQFSTTVRVLADPERRRPTTSTSGTAPW